MPHASRPGRNQPELLLSDTWRFSGKCAKCQNYDEPVSRSVHRVWIPSFHQGFPGFRLCRASIACTEEQRNRISPLPTSTRVLDDSCGCGFLVLLHEFSRLPLGGMSVCCASNQTPVPIIWRKGGLNPIYYEVTKYPCIPHPPSSFFFFIQDLQEMVTCDAQGPDKSKYS